MQETLNPKKTCHAARGMELTISVGRERVEDSSVMRVVVGTFHRLGSHYFRSERVLHPEHMLEKKPNTNVCASLGVCTSPICLALFSVAQINEETKHRSQASSLAASQS